MWTDLYVSEKLRELEGEQARRRPHDRPARPTPLLAPLAGLAGRTLSRIGERLESWGARPSSPDTGTWPLPLERSWRGDSEMHA